MNLRFLLAGVIAGFAVMALDLGLAFLTLGYWVHLTLANVLTYVAGGVVAAAIVEGVGASLRRRPVDMAHAVSLSAALLYLGPVIERFYGTAEFRGLSAGICLAAASFGSVGYLAAVAVLSRIAGPARRWLGPGVATLAVSVGLSVNRNVFFSSVAPEALVGDLAIGIAAFAAAALGRASRGLRLAGAGIAIAVCAGLFVQAYASRSTSAVSGEANADQPDLVMILIDTLRYDVFTEVVSETTEGRAFAAAVGNAAWFENLVAAAPWTAPSVASIMTGLYPREHGFERADPNLGPKAPPMTRLGEGVTTIAERLSEHGYVTDGIVTNQAVARPTGMARGFQRYELLSDPRVRLPLLGSFTTAGLLHEQPYAQADMVRRRLASHLPSLLETDAPVFLYLHLLDPHDPLLEHGDLSPDPGAAGLAEVDRLYRDETRFALREVTAMLEMLKRTPRWERTLLVVLSDHGEMMPSDGHVAPALGEDGRPQNYGHGFALYEGLIRVPLVIRPPGGLPEPRHVDALASHVDLHNTILDLLGIPPTPLGEERVDLAAWLSPAPKDVERREVALSGSIGKGPRQRSLRGDGFKLIDFPDGERPPELYDLESDPGEATNLREERPADARAFEDRLDRIWAQLGESPESAPVHLTPEMQQQLEALGYIDGDGE